MLTLYRTRKSEDSHDIEKDIVIPAGRPYLTKVNGKLVMAREKKTKTANIAVGLLGEAFGARTNVRRRSRSVESQQVPLLLTGSSFDSAQAPVPTTPSTTPIPQQPYFQPFNPYLGGPPPYMPYQTMPWNPSMMQMPQYAQQPPYYATQQTAPKVQTEPSKEDIEDLKRISGEFGKGLGKRRKRLSAGPTDLDVEEKVTTKTTVTITKHTCANCGRLRSRKYHAENPVKAGGTPTPAFCRKCQKDTSETSDSDHTKLKSSKSSGKEKKSKRKDKVTESSKEDETPVLLEAKKQSKSEKKQKQTQTPSVAPELIVVEEELSEEDQTRNDKPPKTMIRPESPILGYIVVEEEHLEDERVLRGGQTTSTKPKKKKKEKMPPPEYIVVEEECSDDERSVRHRRPSLGIEESEVGNHPRPENYDHRRQHRRTQSSFPASQSTLNDREDTFDSVVSQRSQRRRIDRTHADPPPAQPWETPHIIRPRSGEETVVVTERYVYKPKRHMEEQRREEERRSRNRMPKDSEEAVRHYHHYHEDWAREQRPHSPESEEELRPRASIPGRYRRDSFENPELALSEDTEYYRAYDAVFHDVTPRERSLPPLPPTKSWPDVEALHYDDAAKPLKPSRGERYERKEYFSRRSSDGSEDSVANDVSSNYRSRSHRDMNHENSEQALVVTPKRSRSPEYLNEGLSDITARERMVETETKRVTFRDISPSSLSSDGWGRRSDASESFLKRKTSWDNSNLGPINFEETERAEKW